MNTYFRYVVVAIACMSGSLTSKEWHVDNGYHYAPAVLRSGNHIKLTNEFLARLDGVKYLVDGYNVKEMIIAQRDTASYLLGRFDKATKKRVGMFVFNGKKVAINFLAKIEQQGKLNNQEQQDLVKLLKNIKEEMLVALDPFIESIAVARKFVIPVIEEWADKRSRKDSFLVRWTDQPGNERELFAEEMKSHFDLYHFCKDLHMFLGDLIYNCPKGYQQFVELTKQNANTRNHTE